MGDMQCCIISCSEFSRRNNTIQSGNFATDFTKTVFRLARNQIGATIIINSRKDHDFALHDMSKGATILDEPYTSQRMANIFQNKNNPVHDGALVLNLFDEPTIYSAGIKLSMDPRENWQEVAIKSAREANIIELGTRHWSAYSLSNDCTIPVLIVVISEEKGRVSLFKNGNVALGVTKAELWTKLSAAYHEDSVVSSLDGSPFDYKHFKAYVTVKAFDCNNRTDVKWYFEHVMKCRLQIYKGKEYSRQGIILPKNEAYQYKQQEITNSAIGNLLSLRHNKKEYFLIINYGQRRLGGIRYLLNDKTKTIDLFLLNIFVERELFQHGVMAYILEKEFCKLYSGAYNNVTFRFERHLQDVIFKFTKDLNIIVDTTDNFFVYYKFPIPQSNDTDSASSSSMLNVSSYKNDGTLVARKKVQTNTKWKVKSLTPLNASLTEENCESLVVRARKESLFTFSMEQNNGRFEFSINLTTRRINWIEPNPIEEKRLLVADKLVGINGVELSSELAQYEKQYRSCGKTVYLQISRPTNCPDRLKFFMDDYTSQLSHLPVLNIKDFEVDE